MFSKKFLPLNMRARAGRLGPAAIALLYAGFAAVWIVASGRLLTFTVDDPALQGHLELLKGLTFVAVTSGLLYLLLRLRRLPPAPAAWSPDIPNSSGVLPVRRLLPLFALLLLLVPLLGAVIVNLYGPQLERRTYGSLTALVVLKTGQIASWLEERGGDAEALAQDQALAARVAPLLRRQAGVAQPLPLLVQQQFAHLRTAYGYDSILLLGVDGSLLGALGERTTRLPEMQAMLRQAVASRQVQRSNLYLDPSGRMQLDWVVPIMLPAAAGQHPGRPVAAAVVLRVMPQDFLFPLIQRWPETSPSGETLLVRRTEAAVLLLNPLRHPRSARPLLQLPLAQAGGLAPLDSSQSEPGMLQGQDYRGVTVLSVQRPVAGTDWHLVAKVDRDEVLEPLHTLVFWVSLVALAAIFAVSAAIVLLWRQQRQLHQWALLGQQARADRLLRQFFDLPFIGIAMVSPAEQNVLQCNDYLCAILGYARHELAAMPWDAITHPDDRAAEAGHIARIRSGQSEGYTLDKRFMRKDGAARFATVDVKCVRQPDGTVDFFVATVEDITERRASEAKIQRLTQLYAAISQCNQAIVRCSSQAELFPQICRDAVQLGGMRMAWIGLLDPASLRVVPAAAFGSGTDYLEGLEISADGGQKSGRGATGSALRNNQPYWCQDFRSDPCTAPWRERAEGFGWRASAALPLCRGGVVVGVFSLYADETGIFDEAVRNLLIEMAADISYALDNFAREAARQQAVLAQQESEAFNISVLDSLAQHIAVVDGEGRITAVNRAWRSFAQNNEAPELISNSVGLNYLDVCGAGEAETQAGIRAVLAGTQPEFQIEYPCHAPQQQRWFAMRVTRLQGARAGAVIAHEDISRRKQDEAHIRLAAQVFEQGSEGIKITDAQQNLVMVNHAFSVITGYEEAEVLGCNPRILSSGLQDRDFYRAMWGAIATQGHWQGEIWNRRKDGSVYPEWLSVSQVLDSQGRLTNYVGIFSDISQYKEAQSRIQRLAHFDALTGLPNRILLNDRTTQALSAAHRNQAPLALMFLDLDRFKHVNDSLGHRIGDALLVALAQRLSGVVREQDTISRLGGDEFILVLPDTDAAGAAHIARILLQTALQPYQIEQHELSITMSIGIATYPGDGEDFEALSKCADIAMYRAKQDGRNNYCFYTPEMQARSMRTLQLENALRRALERDQLTLHYQPQVSLQDDSMTGCEALLRWQHPELGLISPAEFIPIAEDSGQILQLGEWVLRTAARQCSAWIAAGAGPLTMAVNLSAVQFRHPHLPELVMQILQQEGLPPSCLELELTESAAMDNPQAAIVVMDRLHACGIRMSIDDFGTGYSSLSYLKRFQVYKLKIDQSFVRDIGADPEGEAIVSAIISMARSLGLQTIAEGVETAQQLAFLRAQGCGEAQGYYFSKPLPAAQCEALLRQPQGLPA